jgi:hypothetical protein
MDGNSASAHDSGEQHPTRPAAFCLVPLAAGSSGFRPISIHELAYERARAEIRARHQWLASCALRRTLN